MDNERRNNQPISRRRGARQPEKANAQAAADAQDAAMKAEEQRQQAAIGAQRRAIQQGKSTEILNKKKTRSADSDRGLRNANRIARSEGNMRETAQQIKREYQRKRTEEKGEINQRVNDTKGGIVQIKTANEDDINYAKWLSANKPKPPINIRLETHQNLTKRQRKILDSLKEAGDYIVLPRRMIKASDLSYLTASTGVEFSLFTNGSLRLLVRGTNTKTPINHLLNKLRDEAWKFSAHTHPGISDESLKPSPDDARFLQALGQEQSLIFNPAGEHIDLIKQDLYYHDQRHKRGGKHCGKSHAKIHE